MITPDDGGRQIPAPTPLDCYTVDDGLPSDPPKRPRSMAVATACLALASVTLLVGITVVSATDGPSATRTGPLTAIGPLVVPVAALLGTAWTAWGLWRGHRGALAVAIGGSSAGLICSVKLGIDLARYLTAAEPHFDLGLLEHFAPFDVVLAVAAVFLAPVFPICVRPANTRWAERHSAYRRIVRRRRRGLPHPAKPPRYRRD